MPCYLLGMIYYKERNGSAAIEHFLKAIDFDQNYLEGIVALFVLIDLLTFSN